MKSTVHLLVFVLALAWNSDHSFAQNTAVVGMPSEFKDTCGTFASDSFHHCMGLVKPEVMSLVKYFKYCGKEPVFITQPWTEDPHFICEWPQGPILPGHIYSFKVCFYFIGKSGHFNKPMGFRLSTGETITWFFSGEVEH